MKNNVPFITLNDGVKMPAIGLGTYQIRGGSGVNHILAAIKDGYTGIDTATNYDNEGVVGRAIQRSGVNRADLFITSNSLVNIIVMMMQLKQFKNQFIG
ncbi:oxidoreductase of aldo/keto reductase family, subgroup 1 [Lentilactobacillus kosonis]|uniref:Oxidoreductase of aldo/keto reductase family, subgroup 1 n=1 Tax=Lentilactobacillus kosonis TaxID=2810561 RepID=A0A401FJ35_9LACO|nr:oxidoreductase of aldo/keto reductase family, subgroup 1 [Lentilactobacillus kosonis]